MSLLIAVIVVCIFQLAALLGIAYFLSNSLKEQNKTIQMMAMFKKARDPGDVGAMVDLTETLGDPVEKVEIQEEQMFHPEEMDNEMLLKVREQM